MSVAGGPDFTFGSQGQVAVNYALPSVTTPHSSSTDALAVQPDGKVVVAGVLNIEGSGVGGSSFQIGVERLAANGSPDPTFGVGGVALLDQPIVNVPETFSSGDYTVASVAVQPDGKVVVAGYEIPSGGAAEPGPIVVPPRYAVVYRLDANGQVDPTFGVSGKAAFNFTPTSAAPESLAIAPDGSILVGGSSQAYAYPGTPASDVVVARLTPSGTLDPGFGASGVATLAIPYPGPTPQTGYSTGANSLVVQPDGKVVVGTTVSASQQSSGNITYGAPEVARFDANGSVDTSFGSQGIAPPPPGTTLGALGQLALQPDGRIVLAVDRADAVEGEFTGTTYNHDLLAYRLTPQGQYDDSFGLGGVSPAIPINQPPTSETIGPVYAPRLALQADGKILLSGPGIGAPLVARLDPGGALDPSFGQKGQVTLVPNQSFSFAANVLAVGPTGKIDVALSEGSAAQLLASGAPNDFDEDGISDPAVYLPKYGSVGYRPSGGGPDFLTSFGISGYGQTIPAPGAYDGQGVDELAVYLPKYGQFGIRPFAGGPDRIVAFGLAGKGQSIPAPGDYDGSGKTELAVYMPSLGVFAYRPANGGPDHYIPFGFAGAGQTLPAPGDYDGDGTTDIAAYLPLLGAFAIRPSSGGADEIIPFGLAGAGQSIPVPGDYDGSGKTELAVYMPSLGVLAYRPANGGPDVFEAFGVPGAGQTLPAPGDYTGSGKTELAAYLPGLGAFAYRPAAGGPDVLFPFGVPGAGQSLPFTTNPAADGTADEIPLTTPTPTPTTTPTSTTTSTKAK